MAEKQRGRPPRVTPAFATGFRVTELTRRQLNLAQAFVGHKTMQSVLDSATVLYLDHLKSTIAGFAEASSAIESATDSPLTSRVADSLD